MLDSDSFSQFGGKKGMLDWMVDRIFKLLETRERRAAVITSQYDWQNVFEQQDPT